MSLSKSDETQIKKVISSYLNTYPGIHSSELLINPFSHVPFILGSVPVDIDGTTTTYLANFFIDESDFVDEKWAIDEEKLHHLGIRVSLCVYETQKIIEKAHSDGRSIGLPG